MRPANRATRSSMPIAGTDTGRAAGGAPPPRRALRRLLDGLYDAGAVLAALCMTALLTVIVAQMIARWTGHVIRGGTDYAGYLMAAASFLAFAHTLNRGAHIRVELLLQAAGRHRRLAETLCLAIATAISVYLAWYAAQLVRWSWALGDISQGQDATPLWIVQLPVALGAALLALALADNLVTIALTGRSNISADPEQSHAE